MLWPLSAPGQEHESGQPVEVEPAPSSATQPTPPPPVEPIDEDLTKESVSALISAAEANAGLDDATRAKIVEIHKQTIEYLAAAENMKTRTADFDRLRQEAPAWIAESRARLEVPASQPSIEAPADATLAQLEQLRATAEGEWQRAQAAVKELEVEAARRAGRRRELPNLLVNLRQTLDQISEEQTASALAADESGRAARMLRRARARLVSEEIKANEAELLSYDARGELLSARRDLAAREAAAAEQRVALWQDAVNRRRQADAEELDRAAREARRQAAGAHPLLSRLLEKNADLAEEKSAVGLQIESANARAKAIERQLLATGEEFNGLARRFENVGRTKEIGRLLRRRRAELPDVRYGEREAVKREGEVSRVQLRLFELSDERRLLTDINAEARSLLTELDAATGADERKDIEEAVREALQVRRKYLSELISDYDTCFAKLSDVMAAERALSAASARYAGFIDANILWIRSSHPIWEYRADTLRQGWSCVFSLASWRGIARVMAADVRANPVMYASLIVILIGLVVLRRRLRADLAVIAQKVARPYSDSFALTLQAALVTFLLALPWPALMWFFGWRLTTQPDATEFALAISFGVYRTAIGLLMLLTVWLMCRPRGLGEAHFQWSSADMALVRSSLLLQIIPGPPLIFVIAVSARIWQEETAPREGLDAIGQWALIAAMIVLAVFVYRVLRPSRGILTAAIDRRPGRWLDRLKYVWFPAAVGIPLAGAGLAVSGYYYTALQIEDRIITSAWVLLGFVVAYYVLLRWLLVARERLVIAQSRKRLAAARAETLEQDKPGADGLPVVEEPPIDLPKIGEQTRKLLRAAIAVGLVLGVWMVWVDTLPALGFLSHYELRGSAIQRIPAAATGGKATAPVVPGIPAQVTSLRGVEPPPAESGREASLRITLADLVIAVLVAVLTVVLAANLPGLLEIALLQRLPLEPASRYAISTVSRYLISILGAVIAFQQIGIGWSQVQWLAAAATFGLGFGLQEIFANFVSGLILLFERAIRVGDVVTVGDFNGTVSRIRIRATTIVDWDRREIILPNKEFITGRLVNWTLSDSVNRVVIPVGVAYGTDTARARELLLQVARSHPQVLRDPPPLAHVIAFGESSVELNLRVFLPDVGLRLDVRNDLCEAIAAEFARAGIEIAFPQRDVYIHTRSDPPGPGREPTPGGAGQAR